MYTVLSVLDNVSFSAWHGIHSVPTKPNMYTVQA